MGQINALVESLVALRAEMGKQDGFQSADGDAVRKLIRDHLDDSLPLDLFIGWIARTPAALEFLADRLGVSAPDEDKVTVREQGIARMIPLLPAVFKARLGRGIYEDVELIGVVGHLIRVRDRSKKIGLIHTIPVGAIEPEKRAVVQRYIDNQRGTTTFNFDPFEGGKDVGIPPQEGTNEIP